MKSRSPTPKSKPLADAPFAAQRLLAIDSTHLLLLGTTEDRGDKGCPKLAAVWLDARGQVDRGVRIPHDDCIRSIDEVARGANGEITLATSLFFPVHSELGASGTPALVRLRPNGSLDSSFAGGIVHTSGGAFGLLSDGSVVASEGRHYLNNGEIDPHFGRGGIVGVFGTFDRRVTVWPDDSFAVLSLVRNPQEDAIVQRFTPKGLIDRGFGEEGMTRTNMDPRISNEVGPLLRTPDGGLLAFGSYVPAQAVNSRFVLLKYKRDGHLDPQFGKRGRVVILPPADAGHHFDVRQVTLQRDGDPVVIGRTGGKHVTTLVLRYRPNGEPDRSFGKDGLVQLRIGNSHSANLVALGDGKLIGTIGDAAVVTTVFRLDRNGELDRSFGKSGLLRLRP
jgi:uncharacterized delta-60 repeat protein